jgi:hypothetical protein
MESMGGKCVSRRELAGDVSAGTLVSEGPEVELGEETSEVRESKV